MAKRIAAVIAAVLPALSAATQGQTPSARGRLVAAKSALYDSNFRNDQAGLRSGIAQALEASRDPSIKPLALYYAAWGEWTLSHAHLQSGDLAGTAASLVRAEEHARAGLALRPADPEFIVMLANALIWRAIAEPKRFGELAPEVRTLRTKALDLAPENPRAIIMDAGLIFNTPPERGGDRERGLARWQQALELFERQEKVTTDDELRPDWGRALAYGWVCDLYLAMKPPRLEEARSAAQTALRLRPDFWYVNHVVMPRLKR